MRKAKLTKRKLSSRELKLVKERGSLSKYRRVKRMQQRGKKAIIHHTEDKRPFIMTRAKEGRGTRRLYLK